MKKPMKVLELIDCGCATRQTKGLAMGFFREGAPPPFDLTFVHP